MALTHAMHDMRDEMHDLAHIAEVDGARQGYLAMWGTFIALPLLYGLDKFAGFMNVAWGDFLASWVHDVLPGSGDTELYTLGVIELGIAALVFFMPRVGGDVAALYMVLFAVNFFAMSGMAIFGIGSLALAFCAVAMARMSTTWHHHDG
ncbi:hypothetical protein GCM10011584_29540 [Nocardioides phosphati]|uniref:DoxX family protein n=1 Tax=Nocardioides phosphati TaxID=1867775 RepID=A0ABQ2NFF3_9ACTN|nr:hypothetical protein [Nocardioides phosphati]GGO92650.1 hypothetical protein GCM10011584_29540 [Nocardioides phosphati]